jgi:hypothetical protein
MKRNVLVALSVVVLTLVPFALAAAEEQAGSWKGEIVDVACYVPKGAKGAGHAGCAKKCVESGQPVGLLTADGDMILLAADHADGKPFASAKALAGSMAEVSGTLSTRGGMKVVTVTGVKPAA